MDSNTKDVLLALIAALAPLIGGYMAARWHITVKTFSAGKTLQEKPTLHADKGNAGPMGQGG